MIVCIIHGKYSLYYTNIKDVEKEKVKEEESLKENIAPLPSTSHALRELWVGECACSRPPTPTPRMLGRSSRAGVSTGDVRHPLPSPTLFCLFSPRSMAAARPIR